jgi:hypothetical protein
MFTDLITYSTSQNIMTEGHKGNACIRAMQICFGILNSYGEKIYSKYIFRYIFGEKYIKY